MIEWIKHKLYERRYRRIKAALLSMIDVRGIGQQSIRPQVIVEIKTVGVQIETDRYDWTMTDPDPLSNGFGAAESAKSVIAHYLADRIANRL